MQSTITRARNRALSPDALKSFEDNGYLVVRQLVTPAEVAEIRDTFMAQAANGPVPGLSDNFRKLNPDEPLARYPRMMHPHRHPELPVGPLSMRYLLDARIEAILHDLFGEEPFAAQSMFYFKPAGSRGQALHQDNFYLRVSPGTCMAAWLSLDDADQENGGMVVVPGSHKLDIACPERADSTKFFTMDSVPIPDGLQEEPVNLKAGDMLFFNGSVIHGSYPNTSEDRFRRSLIGHYIPAGSVEVAYWYRPLFRFDGEEVLIAEATGGGPCGTAQPAMGPH